MSAPRVAIVGGGITGLATAFRLTQRRRDAEVVVFEASDRLGGKIRTTVQDGFPLEEGADSFVARKPWAIDLARDLGLGEDLVVPAVSGANVWVEDGRLLPYPDRSAFGIPASVGDLLRWPGLTRAARLRAAADTLLPAGKDEGDGSLATLLRRRLGTAAARTLVEPLLAGVHAGDPERLSVAATFPELGQWDRTHGSLIRGARAASRAASAEPRPIFATVWGGLSRMVDALEVAIGPDRIRRGFPVSAVTIGNSGHGHEVVLAGGEAVRTDAVVLAVPAFEASRLLGSAHPLAAEELSSIPYVSTAVVSLVFPPGTDDRLPEGTGFVVPASRRVVTACTWVSRKWPREEHAGRAIVRCFVGRAGTEESLELPDSELIAAVTAEVDAATPLGRPLDARVTRWPRSMPQYEVGHLDAVARIDRSLAGTGLFVAGSAYRGVGIADCIRQGEATADLVTAHLDGGTDVGDNLSPTAAGERGAK